MASEAPELTEAAVRPGLRKLKKDRTRAEIQVAAVELFERNGYEATTVDEIAYRAEVSPSTFFRYFKTKEDVLFGFEEEHLMRLCWGVRSRPDKALTVLSLCDAFIAFAEWLETEGDAFRRQARIALTTPVLESRVAKMQWAFEGAVAGELARESGAKAPDMTMRLLGALSVSAYTVALREWRTGRSKQPLPAIVRELFGRVPGLAGADRHS